MVIAGTSESRHVASNLATVLCLRSLEASGRWCPLLRSWELKEAQTNNATAEVRWTRAVSQIYDGMMNPASRGGDAPWLQVVVASKPHRG